MKLPVRSPGIAFEPGQSLAAGGEDPFHWRKRGAKLYLAGDHQGAAKAFQRYLSMPIRHPALVAIANAMRSGQLQQAEGMARQYLTANRDDSVAFRMLGQILLRGGNPVAAEQIFRSTLNLAPAFHPVRYDLASALLILGRAEEVLVEATVLLRAEPRNPNYRAMRAAALGKLGQGAEAAAIYAGLVKDVPDQPGLWVSYGNALRPLRRRDDAIDAFRRATQIAPHHGEAWWNLANLKTGALDADDVVAIRAALASDKPSAEDRYHLSFALARALEDARDFAASFAAYEEANSQRKRLLPVQTAMSTTERVAQMIALFTPEFLASRRQSGDPSREPIFILGMPRSGSTLVEQILACHPAIEGTQELPDLVLIARDLDLSGPGGTGDHYPAALADLDPDRLRALGERYLAGARGKRKTERLVFLDKQPANWLHVGLIKLILPNARIIDTRRDPLACCLSMYHQHFARGAAFSYSVDALAAEYRAYHQLLAHFDVLLPGDIKRVALADLVADTEGTVRDLLTHLGLPFAPECLRFFESDRPVFTPSAEQVRRPINRDSDALMAGFAPHLGGLRAALGDLAT